jgi:hypothetical protein
VPGLVRTRGDHLGGAVGVDVDHVSVYRWVQRFSALLIEAARSCRHVPGDKVPSSVNGPYARRRRGGRPQRSEDRTGPATSGGGRRPHLTRVRKLLTERACVITRRAHCGPDARAAQCLPAGTSAIGREQTRGGTFCGLGALGEIDPVLEDGVDGRSRREAVGLDDAGADPLRDGPCGRPEISA